MLIFVIDFVEVFKWIDHNNIIYHVVITHTLIIFNQLPYFKLALYAPLVASSGSSKWEWQPKMLNFSNNKIWNLFFCLGCKEILSLERFLILGRGILPPKLDKNINVTNEKLYCKEDHHIGHAAHVQVSVICLFLCLSEM